MLAYLAKPCPRPKPVSVKSFASRLCLGGAMEAQRSVSEICRSQGLIELSTGARRRGAATRFARPADQLPRPPGVDDAATSWANAKGGRRADSSAGIASLRYP